MEQDNKMTPGNLGIVFGPTLLRPRPTKATVSLSSLVDYPHQARIVETLITHYGMVFEEKPEEDKSEEEAAGQVRWQVSAGAGGLQSSACGRIQAGRAGESLVATGALSEGSFKQRPDEVWAQICGRPCWVRRLWLTLCPPASPSAGSKLLLYLAAGF